MGRRICPTDFGPGRSPPRPTLRLRGVLLALCALFLFGQESGIPYGQGLVKNAYVGRTFIQPTQTIRQLASG